MYRVFVCLLFFLSCQGQDLFKGKAQKKTVSFDVNTDGKPTVRDSGPFFKEKINVSEIEKAAPDCKEKLKVLAIKKKQLGTKERPSYSFELSFNCIVSTSQKQELISFNPKKSFFVYFKQKTIEIVPSDLEANINYKLVIRKGLLSKNGLELKEDFYFSFNLGMDNSAPAICAKYPDQNQSISPYDAPVFYFNEELFVSRNIKDGGDLLPRTFSNRNRIILNSVEKLSQGADYHLNFNIPVSDRSGNFAIAWMQSFFRVKTKAKLKNLKGRVWNFNTSLDHSSEDLALIWQESKGKAMDCNADQKNCKGQCFYFKSGNSSCGGFNIWARLKTSWGWQEKVLLSEIPDFNHVNPKIKSDGQGNFYAFWIDEKFEQKQCEKDSDCSCDLECSPILKQQKCSKGRLWIRQYEKKSGWQKPFLISEGNFSLLSIFTGAPVISFNERGDAALLWSQFSNDGFKYWYSFKEKKGSWHSPKPVKLKEARPYFEKISFLNDKIHLIYRVNRPWIKQSWQLKAAIIEINKGNTKPTKTYELSDKEAEFESFSMNKKGEILAVWRKNDLIWARVYDSMGEARNSFLLEKSLGGHAAPLMLENGKAIVLWNSGVMGKQNTIFFGQINSNKNQFIKSFAFRAVLKNRNKSYFFDFNKESLKLEINLDESLIAKTLNSNGETLSAFILKKGSATWEKAKVQAELNRSVKLKNEEALFFRINSKSDALELGSFEVSTEKLLWQDLSLQMK